MLICRSIELHKILLINSIQESKAFTKFIDGSLKYVFINRIFNYIRKLTIDESFKAEANFMFLFIEGLEFNGFTVTTTNNDIIISYSYKYYYENDYLNYITVNEKLNLDLESMSCKINPKIVTNNLLNEEIDISNNWMNGTTYNVIDGNITIAYYDLSTNLIRSYPVSNLTFTDVTDCIWPRYEESIDNCSFPLPEFILNSQYNFTFGRFLIFKHCNLYLRGNCFYRKKCR